ncbi:MAG: STAS domain-containing protein [Chitinispirillia bacterium]|nr:STAS domain-containing protein [Chitinispirillia bacterium]
MKCYEITGCGKEQQKSCFVYKNFQNNINDMENISCWVLKKGSVGECSNDQIKCDHCPYYAAMNEQSITVKFDEHENVIIECRGTLNTIRSSALGKVADKLKKDEKNNVILDLSSVSNIYSCGLSMIVRFHLQCEELGGTFVLVGATGYVMVALKTTSFDRFIKQAQDMEEALRCFG